MSENRNTRRRWSPRVGLMIASGATIAALAGCGGSGGDSGPAAAADTGAGTPGAEITADQVGSSSAFVAVVKALLAGASDTSEPSPVPAAAAAGDDSGDPVPTGA